MFERIRIFLGPARLRGLIGLLVVTGFASLGLNLFAEQFDWVPAVQMLLALGFLVGAVVIIGGRLDPGERGRWTAILMPAAGLLVLGLFFLPHLLLLFAGGAVGWVIAGVLIFQNSQGPIEYRQAVKAMRKGDYTAAVETMNRLIKAEPATAQHYRFRAELLRLWGKLGRARRDYLTMIELAPDSPVAHNGLAEVHIQSGDYNAAFTAALKAHKLAPDDWVSAYNLGMIADRLGRSEQAIEYLQTALRLRVPEARHRLLVYLYLARAHSRLGAVEAAQEAVKQLRKQRSGLQEWQVILQSEQSATLREVMAGDIAAAAGLMSGELLPEKLAS